MVEEAGQSKTKTVSRADLAVAVHRCVGLSQAESAEIVDALLREICGALVAGENVKLHGFGTLSPRSKGPRKGRNPKTGVPAVIEARKVVSFKPSQTLRSRVDGAASGKSNEVLSEKKSGPDMFSERG